MPLYVIVLMVREDSVAADESEYNVEITTDECTSRGWFAWSP